MDPLRIATGTIRRAAARMPTCVTLKDVKRRRGRQRKDQAQRDGWLRDGPAAYVESLCAWE